LAFDAPRVARGYALQCDVHSDFASVDHDVLMSLLARRIGDARLLALLNSLIDHGAERPGIGMPIGNLTSQMFANLYLDPFDHFVKETLRVRHYIRYMDDFILLVDGRNAARAGLAAIEAFLLTRLRLRLNPSRVVLAPLTCARDVLGYIHRVGGPTRIRRRSVRRLWRRIATLDERLGAGRVAWASARASLASWFGLAARRRLPAVPGDLQRPRHAKPRQSVAGQKPGEAAAHRRLRSGERSILGGGKSS
jgi:hypothetical protein